MTAATPPAPSNFTRPGVGWRFGSRRNPEIGDRGPHFSQNYRKSRLTPVPAQNRLKSLRTSVLDRKGLCLKPAGVTYYQYRWYDPMTGRWPSRDPIGERGGVNLYGILNNRCISEIEAFGLSTHYEVEVGAALGIGSWAKAEFDYKSDGLCNDGKECWTGSVKAEGHVGIAIGLKLDIPLPPPFPSGIKRDIWFSGPNISEKIEIKLSRKCDGIYGGGTYTIGSIDWGTRYAFGLSLGAASFSMESEINVEFGLFVDVLATEYAVNVKILYGWRNSGTWEYDYGLFGITDHDEGILDTKPSDLKTLWEKTFIIDG